MNITAKLAISIPLLILGIFQCVRVISISKQVMLRKYKEHWADVIKQQYTLPEEWGFAGKIAYLVGWSCIGIGIDILFLQYFPWDLLSCLVCIFFFSRAEAHFLGFYHMFWSRDFVAFRAFYELLEGRRR